MLDLEVFISKHITKRAESMFAPDLKQHHDLIKAAVRGKQVLVIGGAGSIGSSFIRAMLPFRPASLTVVDTNENALTELTRDLRSTPKMYVPPEYLTYPMDYASKPFERMFRDRDGFQIVANFSAHKHVRSEKDIYSVEALLRNNVINAKHLLELLSGYPPEVYFCVSTDKAANPVNIMGASKRIMEDLIFSYSDRFPVKTARFANVAFSNGSLLDGFLHRMQKHQPLAAPNDVKRYFVSPEESGQICLLAAALGNNREIFFPKLDAAQMMSFDTIAEALLKENGYEIIHCNSDEDAVEKSEALKNGSRQYPVHFSASDTSGEKMFEEFYTDDEMVEMDRFQSLGVITDKEIPDSQRVKELINVMDELLSGQTLTKEGIVHALQKYLPGFEHIETEKSLDAKM